MPEVGINAVDAIGEEAAIFRRVDDERPVGNHLHGPIDEVFLLRAIDMVSRRAVLGGQAIPHEPERRPFSLVRYEIVVARKEVVARKNNKQDGGYNAQAALLVRCRWGA